MTGFWKSYGRLSIVLLGLAVMLAFKEFFARPLAFVSGISEATLSQYVTAGFLLVLTLLLSRFVRRDVIHGLLEKRSAQEIPPLIGDLVGALVFFVGFCLILTLVFDKDITAILATGGAGLMVLGLALRDMLLAAFTGLILNIEKPFKAGDFIRVDDRRFQYLGKVKKITWRTTVLETTLNEVVVIPNLSLANAVVINFDAPDHRSRRNIEVVIDYDTSVESAERILYAAALGADVELVVPPAVNARRMERDGVVYEVGITIPEYKDYKLYEHAVIKSILQRMHDAGITVTFPKSEVIHAKARARIAGRSLDRFYLVQQCRLFRPMPDDICRRVADALQEHHFPKGTPIVQGGERRFSLFIVGEGMAKRKRADQGGGGLVEERFIATEFFGRRALFSHQPQTATVVAETNVLVYELEQPALVKLFVEMPDLPAVFAHALAQLHWNKAQNADSADKLPDPVQMERLVNLYRGQIAACYGSRSG
ncbi:MAG: mechanosensitive ion channel [Methylococcaceae bacterium]|nr:MAG: mechanosensitive ion channel [Methylococcaceae bacterium]